MSSNSILGSAESEKRWVLEMDKNFPPEHIVDIDLETPFCVFRVPESLSETKPEAYAPQQIGLGPYHHLRPEFYMMQKEKHAAVRKFLNQEKPNTIQQVVGALVEWEPVLRACYDQYLDLHAKTLAWILAIDGLYLLQFLKNSKQTGEIHAKDPQMDKLVGDVIMLENQIPAVLLKKIRRVLGHTLVDEGDDHTLFGDFQAFCDAHSPLKLSKDEEVVGDMSQAHLLHRMYHLVVNNRMLKKVIPRPKISKGSGPRPSKPAPVPDSQLVTDVKASLQFLDEQGMPGAGTAGNILTFMEKVPWDRILALFPKDQEKPLFEEIDIPSVSQMTETAGITFTLTDGGIKNIQFIEAAKRFHLPVITLNAHSEIILRNLVAYEAASAKPGKVLEFAQYVDLMCGIIDTKKDVDILKKAKIIEGELPDQEIISIFNRIRKSTGENEKAKSNIEQAIDNANKKFDEVGSVKVKKLLKTYFDVSWKYFSVVLTVVVLLLLTLQAFCSVFGCSRWFGKSTAVQGFHFLYADQ
ncbi:hypothetical protein Sango_2790300 [Sesamum angolense]|uniref:Uncharacterized protein n=1 Tax=Sesamum angolense TaxID=2727404 RepID=A0AAE1T870_9LAMI|nr:hypothetical protein Sango_2790300 [Sesamum angolense]